MTLPQALSWPEQERVFRLAGLPVGLSWEARLGQLLAWQLLALQLRLPSAVRTEDPRTILVCKN